jgi:signal transduction histidine kinase
VGVLILLRRIGRPEFSDADLATAETFAGQAAISLMLAEGRRREEEAELLEERARIARDLHDLVVQELFAMGMRLSRLRERVGEHALVDVDSSLESLDRVVRQIRSTIRDLRDPAAPSGLVDRVHAETARARSFLGFAPQVEVVVAEGVEANEMVPAEVVDDVIAVIREGLSNAARHARASAVVLTVTVTWTAVRVDVRDDGVGLPARIGRRSGLDNLDERARRHGGDFSATTRPDGGTHLRWSVPLTG